MPLGPTVIGEAAPAMVEVGGPPPCAATRVLHGFLAMEPTVVPTSIDNSDAMRIRARGDKE
jgi:hypothetical protein